MDNSVNQQLPEPQVTTCKERKYSAAHQLPWHAGKCKHLHGHTFVLQIQVTGPVAPVKRGESSSGMVADFSTIGEWLTGLDRILDHTLLNTSCDRYPTAERMVLRLAVKAKRELEPRLPAGVWVSKLRFYEEHVFPQCWTEVSFSSRGGAVDLGDPSETALSEADITHIGSLG